MCVCASTDGAFFWAVCLWFNVVCAIDNNGSKFLICCRILGTFFFPSCHCRASTVTRTGQRYCAQWVSAHIVCIWIFISVRWIHITRDASFKLLAPQRDEANCACSVAFLLQHHRVPYCLARRQIKMLSGLLGLQPCSAHILATSNSLIERDGNVAATKWTKHCSGTNEWRARAHVHWTLRCAWLAQGMN